MARSWCGVSDRVVFCSSIGQFSSRVAVAPFRRVFCSALLPVLYRSWIHRCATAGGPGVGGGGGRASDGRDANEGPAHRRRTSEYHVTVVAVRSVITAGSSVVASRALNVHVVLAIGSLEAGRVA
jgi:hypothetical protein